MFSKKMLGRLLILVTILALPSLSCSVQLPFMATQTPTNTPTPTLTPTPEVIIGIDEPAVIKDITMQCGGFSLYGFANFTLTEVIERDKIQLEETYYPSSGKTLFAILAFVDMAPSGCMDIVTVGRELTLACGGVEYDTEFFGLEVKDGKVRGYSFTYEVPENTDFTECMLIIQGELEIPIAPVMDN